MVGSVFSQPQSVDELIKQMQSPKWQDREQAVSRLVALPEGAKTDAVKKILIDELEKEFDRIQKGTFEGDGEQEYYSELYDEVSNMRDERALPFFIKLGSPTALAKYGDKGIPVILEKLDKTATCSESLAYVHILAEALEKKEQGYTPVGATRQSIKKTMITALKKYKQPQENIEWYEKRARECANVRMEVVKGLGHLAETSEADVIPIIKSIAMDDPFSAVRDEAQYTLSKLGKK